MKIKEFLVFTLVLLLCATNLFSQVTVVVTTDGDSVICENGSINIVSETSPVGVYQYQWLLGDNEISGANSDNYSTIQSGKYSLRIRDLDNNLYSSNTQEVFIRSLPKAPQVTFPSPAIICGGTPILLETEACENVIFQWFCADDILPLATSHRFETTEGGAYFVEATDTLSQCSRISEVIYVSEYPSIQTDSLIIENDSIIRLNSPSMSYSVSNKSHIADISEDLTIVDNELGSEGITNKKLLVRYGGVLHISDFRNTVVVERGGTLNGFGAGAFNVAYVKSGGIYNDTHRNTSSDTIYYETGAIIDSQTKNILIPCESIGVIYPENSFSSVNNYCYEWSTGDTSQMINVSNYEGAMIYVEITNGSSICRDSIIIVNGAINELKPDSIPVANAGQDRTVFSGDTVYLDGSGSYGNETMGDLGYVWFAPGGITLSDRRVVNPYFVAPKIDSSREFSFTLLTSCGAISSDYARVVITVESKRDSSLECGFVEGIREQGVDEYTGCVYWERQAGIDSWDAIIVSMDWDKKNKELKMMMDVENPLYLFEVDPEHIYDVYLRNVRYDDSNGRVTGPFTKMDGCLITKLPEQTFSTEDTVKYYVSDPKFKSEISQTYLIGIDQYVANYYNVDSFVYNYVSYEYVEEIYSDTLVIDVNFSANTANKRLAKLKVYPNPTKDKVMISVANLDSDISECYVRITNLSGMVLYNSKINTQMLELNLATFAETGIYVLQIVNKDNLVLETRKLVLE